MRRLLPHVPHVARPVAAALGGRVQSQARARLVFAKLIDAIPQP
jgi:hypothetical protein